MLIFQLKRCRLQLKGNKSPSPGDKLQSGKPSPYLFRVFKHALETDALPPTLTEDHGHFQKRKRPTGSRCLSAYFTAES